MLRYRLLILLSIALMFLFSTGQALAKPKNQICVYLSKAGVVKQVNSILDVPYKERKKARCFSAANNNHLAKPEEIQLKGNVRREDISTSLGRVELRWPRTVESLFGRTPLRAMTDAARTVSRAIRTASFPNHLQNLNLHWKVVFMDENLPQTQIPFQLISNCHPGWMTPPSNIYIVAQRVANGCGGSTTKRASVADADLTEVLVHELGHAVEFQLLKNRFSGDKMRAEGFATWFEMYAADFSSIMSASQVRRKTASLAKASMSRNPDSFQFSGSPFDYARASMYFAAIVDRRGVRGLMEVYASMANEGLGFYDAVKKRIFWDREQLEKEAARFARKYEYFLPTADSGRTISISSIESEKTTVNINGSAMNLTNTENIPGKTIVEHFGLVSGSTVRAKHVGRDIMAGLKNIVGGELKGYTELLQESRNQAVERMVAQAKELGANAVVNVRFSTSSVAQGAAELYVYGTAVRTTE